MKVREAGRRKRRSNEQARMSELSGGLDGEEEEFYFELIPTVAFYEQISSFDLSPQDYMTIMNHDVL